MDQRMVDFIRVLRAAGVRISLAESQDAWEGVQAVGGTQRDLFAATLRATLIKEAHDQPTFDHFFPLFFTAAQPPMQNIPEDLSAEEQALLQQALQALMGQQDAQRDLMQQLMQGHPLTREQLQQLAEQAGLHQGQQMYQRSTYERRMQQHAGLRDLEQLLEQLRQALEQLGMSAQASQEITDALQQNAAALGEQIAQHTGATLAQAQAEQHENTPTPDLLDVPFNYLGRDDADTLRTEIRRLAARLRSRAALRQKRARHGTPDPRRTLRASMRYGGVPLEIRYRTHQKHPALVLICDVSTSMRYCAEFLLTLVYELQDQVARTNSFIFIDDLADISAMMESAPPQKAISDVLETNPPGYYNTDLGHSLSTLCQQHMRCIDHRTTVIILGDGRNNYNPPRIDLAERIQRQARRVIWFNPEHPARWGTEDSDMHLYARCADGVYQVTTLRELGEAVDQILTRD